MKKIDIVQNYTYLGTCISSTGNFTLSLDHLRQKALHVLFSLRWNTAFKSLKPSLACKIFASMISPILTYNSEVWGTFVKSDFKSWKTLQSKKLIYYSLNDIWKCIPKREIWQGELNLLTILWSLISIKRSYITSAIYKIKMTNQFRALASRRRTER